MSQQKNKYNDIANNKLNPFSFPKLILSPTFRVKLIFTLIVLSCFFGKVEQESRHSMACSKKIHLLLFRLTVA